MRDQPADVLPVEEEVRRAGPERATGTEASARGEQEAEAAGSRSLAGPPRPAGDRRKKVLKPPARREVAEWTGRVHQFSERRGSGLIPANGATLGWERHRDPQEALRVRLHEQAWGRVRYSCRQLTVMLRREAGEVNAKSNYGALP